MVAWRERIAQDVFTRELVVSVVWTVVGLSLAAVSQDDAFCARVLRLPSGWTPLQRFLALLAPAMLVFFEALQLGLGAAINPMLSVALGVAAKVSPTDALRMVAAQFAGHVLAVRIFYQAWHKPLTVISPPSPSAELTTARAIAEEAALTFVMAFLLPLVGERVKSSRMRSLAPPLIIISLLFAGAERSGASMNPALASSLALHSADSWESPVVYWVGPLVGAVLAGAALRLCDAPPRAARTLRKKISGSGLTSRISQPALATKRSEPPHKRS